MNTRPQGRAVFGVVEPGYQHPEGARPILAPTAADVARLREKLPGRNVVVAATVPDTATQAAARALLSDAPALLRAAKAAASQTAAPAETCLGHEEYAYAILRTALEGVIK